ncbi:MAG: helix-turn-helix transcriptional regulator [Planctomycetes bacterium]|nr:helix-turn-helix transcriptional regulator [Planctomycetota bacterium]
MKEKDAFPRELLRGSLDLMVLSVLAEEPRYGYLVQKRLREAGGGGLQIQAGTLYPLLHRLEADRLIRSRWDDSTGRRRKWYELTAKGRRQLEKQAREWRRYAECIGRLLGPAVGPPEPAPS